MLREKNTIDPETQVSDIVKQDYRTAAVFRRYGIEYCCGAKFPLRMVCEIRDLNLSDILKELENVSRNLQISNRLPFEEWEIDFLADYIVHVHHGYLRIIMPQALETLREFAAGHEQKFPYLRELITVFSALASENKTHIQYEEDIIFPYIRQIAHAYRNKEEYASLLIRTLSKPVEEVMQHEHQFVVRALGRMRELTGNYTVPPAACVSHKVSFNTLQEIDNDLSQHLHLENNILFPKAIQLEKELLNEK